MNTQAQKQYPNPKEHPFNGIYGPVFDDNSKVLILGSFPPINTSEKDGFYYGAKNNVFWLILGTLFNDNNLSKKLRDEKRAFLLNNKIALWDIWASCYKKDPRLGSDDNIIADKSRPVNLTKILEMAKIQKIFTTIGGSESSKNESDRRGGNFKKWKIEKWLWDGENYSGKKYGGYREYFPHCKNVSEMVTPLYSTSPRGIQTKRVTYEQILNDYEQIKKALEKQ